MGVMSSCVTASDVVFCRESSGVVPELGAEYAVCQVGTNQTISWENALNVTITLDPGPERRGSVLNRSGQHVQQCYPCQKQDFLGRYSLPWSL